MMAVNVAALDIIRGRPREAAEVDNEQDESPGALADNTAGGGGPSASDVDEARISRRSALRKAAAGAAVAGAVWAAPRVEGLSIVPDYAAAASGSVGALTLNLDARDGCDANAYNSFADQIGVSPSPGWTINTANSTTKNGNVVASATLPGVGNPNGTVTATLPGPNNSSGDVNATYNIAVVFSGIDPPFNNCRVSAASANACIAGTVGMSIGPQPYNNSPATERNPLSTFPVTVSIPGPQPVVNFGEGTIVVRCD